MLNTINAFIWTHPNFWNINFFPTPSFISRGHPLLPTHNPSPSLPIVNQTPRRRIERNARAPVLLTAPWAFWMRDIKENTGKKKKKWIKMSSLLGLEAPQCGDFIPERSVFLTAAVESPARLAWGELRTSALGLADTPSSHTNLTQPRHRGGLQGWCHQPCHSQSWRAGAADRLALDPSGATGWRR